MLTDEQIWELSKPFITEIGGDHWNSGDDGIRDNGRIEEFARAVEAATLATVTPLLRQVMWAMTTCGVNDGYEGPRQCFDEDQIDAAKEAISAFLSGATKERERMEAALQSPRISIPPSMSPEEVRAWIEKHAQPAQAGADRAGGLSPQVGDKGQGNG